MLNDNTDQASPPTPVTYQPDEPSSNTVQPSAPEKPAPAVVSSWPAPIATLEPVAAVAVPPSSQPDLPKVAPQPVVQVLSPRGVEYVFLIITLFMSATGLGSALIALVNGKADYSSLAFPAALSVIGVPLFAWLFIRLKRAELRDPALALDASKRRSTQTAQIISFITCLIAGVAFVSAIFAKVGGGYDGSLPKLLGSLVIVIVIAGGILAYYWRDEHKV